MNAGHSESEFLIESPQFECENRKTARRIRRMVPDSVNLNTLCNISQRAIRRRCALSALAWKSRFERVLTLFPTLNGKKILPKEAENRLIAELVGEASSSSQRKRWTKIYHPNAFEQNDKS